EIAGFDAAAARRPIEEAAARGPAWLSPHEGQTVLSACGIPLPKARLAASAREAARAGREIGLPGAGEGGGSGSVPKDGGGGVKLSLSTEAAVGDARAELVQRLGNRLSGVLVQEMVEGGAEMMVGAVVDPTFGPVVAYGSGGVLVELLGDVSFRIAPLTDTDVAEMLDEVKGTALLRGFRGAAPLDEAALKDVLHRVSRLLETAPDIQEMDLNRVKVLAEGVRVLDARIRVAPLPPRPASRRVAY